MQNPKLVRPVAGKGGHLRRQGFDRICMPYEAELTVLQVSHGTYAASKTQCSDCKGVGERLKEKER